MLPPAQIRILSKATHGGQGSVSLLANPLLSLKWSLSPPLGLQRFSPFTETHKSWPFYSGERRHSVVDGEGLKMWPMEEESIETQPGLHNSTDR